MLEFIFYPSSPSSLLPHSRLPLKVLPLATSIWGAPRWGSGRCGCHFIVDLGIVPKKKPAMTAGQSRRPPRRRGGLTHSGAACAPLPLARRKGLPLAARGKRGSASGHAWTATEVIAPAGAARGSQKRSRGQCAAGAPCEKRFRKKSQDLHGAIPPAEWFVVAGST